MQKVREDTVIDGEYRHVVAMMADLVESSRITEELGAERGFLMIREVIQIMAEAADSEGGKIINYVGDGVFAIFGAPRATETAGLDACRAALRIRDSLMARASVLEGRFGIRPEVRIGLAGGEVLVLSGGGRDQIDASGSAVNYASRLQALAGPGEIVCSEDIRENLAGLADCNSKGQFEIRGYTGTREVFAISGLSAEADPKKQRRRIVRAAFVGRQKELEALGRWQSRSGGSAAFCVVEGTPGMGKSRLLQAFIASQEDGVRAHVGQCVQDVGRTLAPLVEILRGEIGWQDGWSAETVTSSVQALLPGRRVPSELLSQMVSGTVDHSRLSDEHSAAVALQEDIIDALHLIGCRRDRLLVVEDAHWIDALSAQFLRETARRASADFRLLITSRLNQGPDWLAGEEWAHVRLPALTREDVGTMAQDMLEGVEGTSEMLDLVASKSEGNPFFIEEILRHVRRTGKSNPESIGSIQNLVFSRFDGLDDGMKDALRLAATMGRSFGEVAVRAAAGRDALVGHVLLRDSVGLLEEAPGAGRLRFAHVLIRDVIYSSIPASQRPAYHARVAVALEALDPSSDLRPNEALAEHFEAAGDVERAIQYHADAARAELQTYALSSCDARMERVFALLDGIGYAIPGALFSRLMETRIRALDLIGKFGVTRAIMPAHVDRITDTGARLICQILHSKALCHGGFYEEALSIGEEAIAGAEAAGDAHALAFARVVQMRNLMDSGRQKEGEIEALFDQTADVPEAAADRHILYMRLYIIVAFYRRMGQFGKAWELNEELKALGARHGDTRGVGYGAWSQAVLYRFLQDNDGVKASAEVAVKNTINGTSDRAVAETALLMAKIEAGEAGGPADFNRIIETADSNGNYPLRNAALLQQAIAHFRFGEMRAGWAVLMDGLERFKGTSTAEHQMFAKVAMAEIWLAIAGLMPNTGEWPKLSAADILFVLRLRLGARAKAEAAVAEARKTMEEAGAGGFLEARVCLAEGLLLAKKDSAAARAKFEAARDLFKAEGMTPEVRRVEAILAAQT